MLFYKNGQTSGNNTFINLTLSSSYSYILQSGTTQTITGNFNATGNCGAFVDVSSNNAGTAANINKTTGVVNASYLVLKDRKYLLLQRSLKYYYDYLLAP